MNSNEEYRKKLKEIFEEIEQDKAEIMKKKLKERDEKKINEKKINHKKGIKKTSLIFVFLLPLIVALLYWKITGNTIILFEIPQWFFLIIILIGLFFPPAFFLFSVPLILILWFFSNLGIIFVAILIPGFIIRQIYLSSLSSA